MTAAPSKEHLIASGTPATVAAWTWPLGAPVFAYRNGAYPDGSPRVHVYLRLALARPFQALYNHLDREDSLRALGVLAGRYGWRGLLVIAAAGDTALGEAILSTLHRAPVAHRMWP